MIRSGELKSVQAIADKAESFVPNDTLFHDAFAVARISKANLSRYYLRELERHERITGKPELVPNPDPAELTLEHILPEKPAVDAWKQFTPEEAKGYTKRLGNMVLLTQKMNSRIRSSSFSVKRKVYEKSELLLQQSATGTKKL
jgi:hypothetical protein